MSDRRRVVGLAVIVVLVLGIGFAWRGPDLFASTVTVRAELSDANGLAPIGADVRIAGVPVGAVTGVQRRGRLALLSLTIDSSVGVIHRDATVALQPRLMFEGTAYVTLTLGSPESPAIGARVIPVSQTSTYVPVEDTFSLLSAHLRPSLRAVANAGAQALSGAGASALHATIAATPGLQTDAGQLAAAARGPHRTELRQAVSALSHVASAAASQAPAIGSAVSGAAATLTSLDVSGGNRFGSVLGSLARLSGELTGGARSASAILARLRTLTPALVPGVEQLAPTLTDLTPLLRSAPRVLTALKPVLDDAQTALVGARDGAPATGAALSAMRPTLATLQHTLLAALTAPTDLGDPAYLAFLGLFEGGGGASSPFGIDGQGHFMRFGLRFLTGAGQPLPPCTLIARLSAPLASTLAADGGCTS